MNDIRNRSHALNHSHVTCVIGAFNKILMKALFGLVIELLYCLFYTNQYFFSLCIMVQDFMTNIYHQKGKKYIDDDRSGEISKQQVRKI